MILLYRAEIDIAELLFDPIPGGYGWTEPQNYFSCRIGGGDGAPLRSAEHLSFNTCSGARAIYITLHFRGAETIARIWSD